MRIERPYLDFVMKSDWARELSEFVKKHYSEDVLIRIDCSGVPLIWDEELESLTIKHYQIACIETVEDDDDKTD